MLPPDETHAANLKKHTRRLCMCLLLSMGWLHGRGQQFAMRNYTIEQGLPGNNLHCLVQDDRGFIWIGTENGLVRFDGSSFRQYRMSDGLPDNEIVSLKTDAAGRLWALTYQGGLSFYDPLRDHFQKAMDGGTGISILDNGSIAVGTRNAVTVIRNNSMQQLARPLNTAAPLLTVSLGPDRFLLIAEDSFRLYEGARPAGSQPSLLPPGARVAYLHQVIYYCDSNGICKTAMNSAGRIQQMCIARRTINASQLSFTGKHLALISDNGTTASLIDTATLNEVLQLPLNGAIAKDVLEDAAGNIWIATIGQGLLKLSAYPVTSYRSFLPPDMSPSVVAVDGAVLLCGDDRGRIAVFRNGCMERMINISKWSKAVSRIRSIVVLKEGYYIAVEGDASLLLDKQYNIASVYNRPYLNYSDRYATLWRDSIILAGSHARAVRLDYRACHAFDTVNLRALAIGADRQGRLIIGSSDGVYRKDDTGLYYLGSRYDELSNRVNDLCLTGDGLMWVASAAGYLVALDGDRIAGVIHFGKDLPGNVCNALAANNSGELWAGTDASLSRIRYRYVNGRLNWHATSFGPGDGISGQVADVVLQGDTVYAATNTGVYSFGRNLSPVVQDIPVFITGVRINDRDTILAASWDMPYNARDWDIHFAGIAYGGYIPGYQYRVNNEAWQDITESHLVLKRLAPGNYNIQIRALKRDGMPSAQAASIRIRLRAPFWMSVWFWAIVFALLLGATIILQQHISRKKRKKQLRQIAAEHELVTSQQQTFSALMNPHFIFNALNSIQHYVLVQDKRAANKYLSGFGRLIRMNFESAQKSYISLEEELERLQLYMSLEQMRFGDKLQYSIEVAEDVVPEDWQIPAMIVQPYLENALLHGIAPATNPGKLVLRVWQEGHDLHLSISDNGVGMAARKRLKQQNGHASRSMELIQKRIAILRKLHRQEIRIEVSDNNTGDALHPGTTISMVFPGHFVG
jgi:ligand-binding sensor domain-containing protein/anti-sigma regulatory factor (Ser/Thr protein kinase)